MTLLIFLTLTSFKIMASVVSAFLMYKISRLVIGKWFTWCARIMGLAMLLRASVYVVGFFYISPVVVFLGSFPTPAVLYTQYIDAVVKLLCLISSYMAYFVLKNIFPPKR